MSTERDPAALLRDGMTAEARTVTAGPAFTERIISAADTQPRRAGWQGWVLPAAAAALVAILVAAALIGTSLIRADRQPPAGQTSPPLATSIAPTPGATSPAPSSGATSGPSSSSSASRTRTAPVPRARPAARCRPVSARST